MLHLTEKARPPQLWCPGHLPQGCLPSPFASRNEALEVANQTEPGKVPVLLIGSPGSGLHGT